MNGSAAQDFQSQAPYMNYGGMSMGGDSQGVLSMRWESYQLLSDVKKILTGMVDMPYQLPDGTTSFRTVKMFPNVKPIINEVGAENLMIILQAFLNPSVALSNIDETTARTLIRQTMNEVDLAINMNQTEWEIENTAAMGIIISAVRPLVTCQIYRAVNGHESRQSKTQTQEIKQDSTNTQRTSGGFSLNPFSKH
jgi:hypothetical protein